MNNILTERTKKFALMVINLVRVLPKNELNYIIAKQVLRSATSTGANYRSALRGKSKADFIYKLCIAEEEADESCYWLEILIESDILNTNDTFVVLKEAKEITAILTASRKTAKERFENK